jgi:hypothetical protein
VRPVREQLEHDRLIRHLQLKYKRKFDVLANLGDEQVAPVKIGTLTLYPDLVLSNGKKLAGIVEVESGESVNNLEAMAQWVHFSRSRVPFHLYVPVSSYETARRLCEANQAQVTEIWTYRPAADGFDLVRMFADTTVRPAKALPPVKPVRVGKDAPKEKDAAPRPRAKSSVAKPQKPQKNRHAATPRKTVAKKSAASRGKNKAGARSR